MYSIDINFLKDREVEVTKKTLTQTKGTAFDVQEQLPMMLGLGAMVLLIAFPLGLLLIVNWQTAQTKKNIDKLTEQVAELTAQNQRLAAVKRHIEAIDENTQSLVTVFNQVKPASAVLQEISNVIPQSVHIGTIEQLDIEPQKGKSENPTKKATQLKINGYAQSFDDVNKFVLTLQSSPFFKADATKIEKAELADLPIEVENRESLTENNLIITFPKGIQYTIVTQLNDLPAAQLLPDLQRNGANGLVTRITTLREKGVLKP